VQSRFLILLEALFYWRRARSSRWRLYRRHHLIDEGLSDRACHLSGELGSVAGAALAPKPTVGAASAAVPVLAAAVAARALAATGLSAACRVAKHGAKNGTVARAALAPSPTVGATGAAEPPLAAAFVVGAQIGFAAAVGGHYSKGKDQQDRCEGFHRHVGSSHTRWNLEAFSSLACFGG
jgi:hypothetical protein